MKKSTSPSRYGILNKYDILVVAPSIPLYDRAAGDYRIYNIIKTLLNRYSVSLLCLRYRPELGLYEKELRTSGVGIIYPDSNGSIKSAAGRHDYKKVIIEFCNTGDDWLSVAKEFESSEVIIDSHCLNFLENERMKSLGLEKSGGHGLSK